MDFKTYRAKRVRELIESGDAPCPVEGFMPWAVMQGLVTEGACDGPYLWVCARTRRVHVGRVHYDTEDMGNGIVRVGEGVVRFRTEKGSGVVSLMVLTQSIPRMIPDWERWVRACDVVVQGAIRPTRHPPALELLACVGAAYGQPPDITSNHELVELRRCLRMAKSRMFVDMLWWIDLAAQTLVAYGPSGFSVRKLVLCRRGTQIYMWPRLDFERSALFEANRHVSKMFGMRCLPYVPYDRLVTFLLHVPRRFLHPDLHEAARMDSWRGLKQNVIDYDIFPAMLSFRNDLTLPSRVPVDDDTYYFHVLVTLPSSSNGQIVFGVGLNDAIQCEWVLSRAPGEWTEYEGAGWAVRSVSRRVRGEGVVFMEIGVLVFEKRTFALCSNGNYGRARLRITWGVVGTRMVPCDVDAINQKLLFGAHTTPDGRYTLFSNGP